MQLILPKQLALQYLLVCEKPLKLSISIVMMITMTLNDDDGDD
jgi:hypothetical protein